MSDKKILFVDDDAELLSSLLQALKANGLTGSFFTANRVEDGLKLQDKHKPQVAVIDLSINPREGVESGFSLLSEILKRDLTCRVIVLTGHGSTEFGVRALNSGAASFLEKPADVSHLLALINDGIKQSNLKREFEKLQSNDQAEELKDLFIGESRAAQALREELCYAASINQTVVLSGETGTGKGLCAAIIHRLSERSRNNFVRYQPNYGTADLANSDLFGHLKGAFTGAASDRKGLIAEAHKGTLFLDEIDALPLETQVALLGVLQERSFRAVGSNTEQAVDFRLVCASNYNLEQAVAEGKLRKDFYHRIAHLNINIPPLRTRLEDIACLANATLKQLYKQEGLSVQAIDEVALEKLKRYEWPGNVRELQAMIEGAANRAQFKGRAIILSEDLPQVATQIAEAESFSEKIEAYKLALIDEALAKHGGQKLKAAEALGLDRSTMRRILARRESS